MDIGLVKRAQGGDQDAFAELAAAIADRFLATSHRIVSDIDLAEDATQQALFSIWQDLPQLRDPARFEAWSYRLLVHACYAEGRKSRRWAPNLRLLSVDEPMVAGDLGSVVDRDELERNRFDDGGTMRPRRGAPGAGLLALFLSLALSACATSPGPSTLPGGTESASQATPGQSAVDPVTYPFPLEATIPELQAAMARGDLTALDLVDFYLARIAAYDHAGPKLNAFILVNPSARDEAAALDAERARSGPRGPLHGIPVVIKDNIGTADMPTTAGSFALQGFVPDKDAFQVQKLRDAGAIILGKTNLFEFAQNWTTASSVGGQTLSPYNLSRDPGGSSGGSAVAVSANFAVLGWGTDTCGSVRYPAVLNDLYGLRPTEGLTSRSGVIPLSTTLDAMGPMARTVVDLAIALQATVGADPADPVTVPVEASYIDAVDPNGLAGRRIGVVRYSYSLDTDVEQLMAAAIGDMEANGAEVVEVKLPTPTFVGWGFDEFSSALDAYFASQPSSPVHSYAELNAAYASHPELDVLGIESWGPMVNLNSPNYQASIAARPVYRDTFVAFMDQNHLDAVIYPESRSGAPPIGTVQEPFDCNLAPHGGFPALSVPIGFLSDGLPVGLELMARPFAEETLIALAAGYEAHTHHRLLPPTAPPL